MLDTLRRTDAQRYPRLIGGVSWFVGPTPGNFPVILNQWYFVFFCISVFVLYERKNRDTDTKESTMLPLRLA